MKHSCRLALLGVALMGCGCGQDTDVLARVGRKVADRVQAAGRDAAGQLTPRLDAVRPAAPEPTLAERVTYRLQWDQALAGADVQVHATEEDVIELKGTVTGVEQRRRAVELAQSTVGAVVVIDALTVEEPTP